MFFLLNAYTTPSLLAAICCVTILLILVNDALIKKRVVRAGLLALLVTPFAVALTYFLTNRSWITLELGADFHTETILYSGKPVMLIHIAASLGRAFLPATWFPAGLVGGIVGCVCGILVGLGRHWRAQSTATGGTARLSRRTLLAGAPVALGLLAVPGIAWSMLIHRGAAFSSARPPSHSPAPVTPVARPAQINSVALSPDGSRVAFGDSHGLLQVWNVQQQKLLFTCHSQAALIESVGWSPDGKRLASSGGNRLDFWDAQRGSLLFTYPSKATDLFPLAWSPDGRYIAASDYWAGRVSVWRLADSALLYTCNGSSMSWSPDSRYLVAGNGAQSPLVVWVYNAPDGKLLFTYRGLSQGIAGQGANFSDVLAWSPDSKRIATGSADTVRVWNALDGGNEQAYQMPNIDALIWLPGSELLVSGANTGEIKGWNMTSGQAARIYNQVDATTVERVWSLTSTPDGAYIAAAFLSPPKNSVRVWEIQNGKLLFRYNQ